jgi:hypothetical protein
MPILTCPVCHLRFNLRPLFELHVREDHSSPLPKDPPEQRLLIPEQRAEGTQPEREPAEQ